MRLHNIDKREYQRPPVRERRQGKQRRREALACFGAIGPTLDPPAQRGWRHLEIVGSLWDTIGRHLTRILPAIDVALLHLSAPIPTFPESSASGVHPTSLPSSPACRMVSQ